METEFNGKVYGDFSFLREMSEGQKRRVARCLIDMDRILGPSGPAGWAAGESRPQAGAQSAGEIAVRPGLTSQGVAVGSPPMSWPRAEFGAQPGVPDRDPGPPSGAKPMRGQGLTLPDPVRSAEPVTGE